MKWTLPFVLLIPLLSACATRPAIEAEFAALDEDDSGSLEVDEVEDEKPDLVENWNSFDLDDNGVLNESEFSAFEEIP